MKIIDSHTHLGTSRVSDTNYTEEQWKSLMKRYHLDGIMSYPNPQAYPDMINVHNRIHQFTLDNPGQVWGVADINPNLDADEYINEAFRCIKELNFVAIKIVPPMHGCNPLGKHCDKVFETAQQLNVPLIVHTGIGSPWALPSMLLPRAQQFPDVRIVLAHAGAHIYATEAIIVAEQCKNVYLEPSWCGANRIRAMINAIGIERIMFGSDGPSNIGVELAKVEAIDMTDREAELYLGKNAIDFYNLK